jgi:DNA helicase-2/ATP-dependent DNA helicase PcrA
MPAMNDLIRHLNPAQQAAVTAPCGHQLILAGAGSGKTRVLVHRIAWLLQKESASPHNILAVTFTNKAAGEMRSRIESLLSYSAQSMWIGTFHGLAHRLLRRHWQEAGLKENFQILDSEDQYRLIRRLLKTLNLDEKQWSPKNIQWFINGKKDEGLRPEHIDELDDPVTKTLVKVYTAYESACAQGGLVDFAELLLRSHEIWLRCPDILAHYQQRFRHILVDEFQDTNPIQYAWIRMLAGQHNNVMVVGDDDQSIYGWRGAKIENLQRFTEDFPNAQVVRLEQNYRSTNVILQAANAMIAHNSQRLGKNLWSTGEEGEAIGLYGGFNEIDEARFIAHQIKRWLEDGHARQEIAILYRSNAQSRALEEALLLERIPYRIYGGLRFFERAEIKDALAYLRLLVGRDDDPAFERVINLPVRGIGERTLMDIREFAREQQSSLWAAMIGVIQQHRLSARATNALQGFANLIEELTQTTRDLHLKDIIEQVLTRTGLMDHHRADKTDKGQSRVENLEELIQAANQFSPDPHQESMSPLTAFLSHVALESGDTQAEAFTDCVQMMTMHSAKGLEFPFVIVAGMEEGLFPHYLSEDDPLRLEEERRLFYVAMTRAMKKLVLTCAEVRRLHGSESYHRPSRFIRDIPQKYVQDIRVRQKSHAVPARRHVEDESGFHLGQRVKHPSFGYGTITNFEGQGAHTRAQVKFDKEGSKWLVIAYANLSFME